MSGGLYTLAELYEENAEWRVIDNDSGLARTPASLSGGEQFIASLALAPLAVDEVPSQIKFQLFMPGLARDL
jgi:DNA repair exonuclease SbcCD ATPase subunit